MSKKRKLPLTPTCHYCGRNAILVDDSAVYSKSYGGKVWLCRHCSAWVGTHRNSPRHLPLGRLAKADLRRQKIIAHDLFDALWRAAMQHRKWSKSLARLSAYSWLAREMGIDKKHCHIGMMDEAQTQRVIDICRPHVEKRRAA